MKPNEQVIRSLQAVFRRSDRLTLDELVGNVYVSLYLGEQADFKFEAITGILQAQDVKLLQNAAQKLLQNMRPDCTGFSVSTVTVVPSKDLPGHSPLIPRSFVEALASWQVG